MTGKKSNLPASIASRLLDQAKRTGDDYQTFRSALGSWGFAGALRISQGRSSTGPNWTALQKTHADYGANLIFVYTYIQ